MNGRDVIAKIRACVNREQSLTGGSVGQNLNDHVMCWNMQGRLGDYASMPVSIKRCAAALGIATLQFSSGSAQLLPLPEVSYHFEELEPHFSGMDVRRHYNEVFGHHVERFNRILKQLRHTAAYRAIVKHGGIDGLLKRLSEVPPALQRKLRYHGGGYVNHELFFRTLRPSPIYDSNDGNNMPDGLLLLAIEKYFGSFDAFQAEFSSTSLEIFGAGWVWLVADVAVKPQPCDRGGCPLRIIGSEVNDHPLMISPSYVPLLCLDVWEHAYFGQFQNSRQRYIKVWWSIVNWDEVSRIHSSIDLDARLSGTESPYLDMTSADVKDLVVVQRQQSQGGPIDTGSFTPATVDAPSETVSSEESDTLEMAQASASTQGACSSIHSFFANLGVKQEIGSAVQCVEDGDCAACHHFISKHGAFEGSVVHWWTQDDVLDATHLFPDGASSGSTDLGDLERLVAALLSENRRIDSRWHDYLEFLHNEFTSARRSALFWPKSLWASLNASLGLEDLRAADRAHRRAAAYFQSMPQLLLPRKTQASMSSSAPPLFDAEIHWAVTLALCRSVPDQRRARRVMLPGSELLQRGDEHLANVALKPVCTSSPQVGISECALPAQECKDNNSDQVTWELTATREIAQGDMLILDAKLSNSELVSRGWSALPGNTWGPVISIPSLGFDKIRTATKVAQIVSEMHPKNTESGLKWHKYHCEDELQAPRVRRKNATAISQALVLCIAYAIRFIDMGDATHDQDASQDDATSHLKIPQRSSTEGSQLAVFIRKAYALIAAGCGAAATQYRMALRLSLSQDVQINSSRLTAAALHEVEIRQSFSRALDDDVAILEYCFKYASRKSRQGKARPRKHWE